MSTPPPTNTGRPRGSGTLGFLLVGLVLGGLLGFALAPHNADRHSPDPQRRTMAYLSYPLELIAQVGLTAAGASIGGAVGAVVGTKLSRGAAEPTQTTSASAGATPGSASPAEQAVDLPLSPTDEIPRIERAIAHLQTRLETLQSAPPATQEDPPDRPAS
jgi:hypothetical protein